MKWPGLALVGLLLCNGCAWKTYDPKLHASTPTPTPTVAADPEQARRFQLFQTSCSDRAVSLQGVQLLDQDPAASVFRLRDGSQATVHFDKLYESEPHAAPALIDEFLARELASNSSPPALDALEPRLRTAVQLQPWRYQLEKSGVPPEQWPVWEPLAGDLFITYVVEPAGTGQRWVVTQGQLARAGMKPEQARQAAVGNLLRRLGPESVSRGVLPDSPLLQVASELAGLRLLDSALLGRLADEAGGDLLVSVPHPGCLMAVSAGAGQARQWIFSEARSRSSEPGGLSAQVFSFAKSSGQLQPAAEK